MPYSGAPDIDQLASELEAKVLDLKRRGKFTPDDEKGYAEVQRLIKERKRDRLMEQDAAARTTDYKADDSPDLGYVTPLLKQAASGAVGMGSEIANVAMRFGPNAPGAILGVRANGDITKRTEEWKQKIQQGLALPPNATMPEKIAGFIGGAVPAIGAIGLAGPEAAPVVAPALFGITGVGRALGEGATESLTPGQTAARAAGYGSVGALSALPFGASLAKFSGPLAAAAARGVAPKLAQAAVNTIAEGVAGSAAMGGQVLGENLTAQQTGSPERKTWEGVPGAAMGGGFLAAGMHGLREVSIDAKATKVRAEQARQRQQEADALLSQATTPEELDLLVNSADEIPPHVQERIPVRRAQLEQEAAQAQRQAEEAAANPPDPQVAEADRIAKLITGVKSGEPAALDELMNDALRAAAVLKDPASTKEAKDQAQKFLDQRVDGQKSVSSLLAKYRIDNGVGEPPKGAAELKKWTENRERREMDRLGAGGEVAPAGPSSRGPMSAAEWKGPIDNPEQQRVLPGRDEAGTPTPVFSEPTQTWTTPETPEARAWREREQARIDKQRIQAENDAKWEAEKSRRRLAEETKARIKAENDAKWEAEKARREEAKRAKEAVDSQLQAEQQASVLQRDKELNSLPDELLAPISKHAPDPATKIAAERILNERKLERQRQQAAARPLPEKAPPTTPIQKELPVKKSGSVTPPPRRVPLQGEAAAPAHEVVQEQDQSPAVGVQPDINALPEKLAATGQFTPEQIALVNKMLGGATDADGNPVVKPGALDERSPITRPTPQQQQNATQRAHVNAENKDEARRLGPEPPPSETEMDDMARSYGQDEPPPADQPSLGEGSPGGVKYSTSPEGQKPVGDGPYMYLDDNGVLRRTRVSPADIKQMQEEARKMAGLPGLTLRGEMWSKGDTEAERRALEAHGVSKEDIAKRGPQRLRGLSTATAIEVSLALERHDIVNANRHEIGHHALEAMSPELRTAVIQDMGQITPKPRVGAETKEQRIGRLEEAFCDNLAGWLGNEKAAPTPALRRAVDAIRRMFDVMGDYLRSKGFKSLGDVFGDAEGAAKRRVEKTFRDVSEGKFAKGGVSGEKAAVRRGEAPGFFSGLRRIIDQKMPARATPEQVKAIIASAKREEADWTGLTDWLAEQNGPITKEQLQQFLAENDVRVQEVELSDNMEHVVDREAIARFRDVASKLDAEAQNAEMRARGATGQMAILARDDARAARAAADMAKRNLAEAERGELKKATDTKYGRQSNLLTPGGENQRELLLTLPERPDVKSAQFALREFHRRMSAKYPVVDGRPWKEVMTPEELAEGVRLRDAATAEMESKTRQRPFTQGHYDEPNVLAHVRFNERTGPNGERILHVEEIQSDWHQQGRREGYSPRKPVRFLHGSELERLRSKAGGHGNLEIYTSGNVHDERMGLEAGLTEAEIARAKELLTEKARIERANLPGSIPDAPFKTSWHELAFKRMLRYAAENGYDKLTWTTGEQQADRYDLSKQVDSIVVARLAGDSFEWSAKKDGDEVAGKKGVTQAQLAEQIGKDLAEKAAKQPQYDDVSYSGVDLKVGGEGMKGFYDKILVDFANKYGKKWGAKVGTSDLNFNESGEWRDAETGEQRHTLVHSIDITPQMKDSVLGEGQPKFSTSGKPDIKFRKVPGAGESESEVLVDGVVLGRVYKTWAALGGNGWTFDGKPLSFPTRERAAAALIKSKRSAPAAAVEAVPQTKTPAFRKWFGESKVVDEKGEPLVVYHGSPARDFNAFDKQSINPSDPDLPVRVFWFSGSEKDANTAGKFPWGRPNAPDAQVRPFFLSASKLATRADIRRVVNELAGNATHESVTNALKAKGFDGVVADEGIVLTDEQARAVENGDTVTVSRGRTVKRNADGYFDVHDKRGEFHGDYESLDDLRESNRPVFGVFEPEQIKSATGNNGNFDASNPDIRYSIDKGERTHIVHGDSGPKKIKGVKLSRDLKTVSYEYWSEAEQAWKPESRSVESFAKMSSKAPAAGAPKLPAPPTTSRPGTAAPRGGEPPLKVREETRASRLRQLLQDNLARLLHIQEDIVGSGRTMKPEHNAYLALEAKNSKTKYEMDKFRDNHIKPMLDELDKAKISLDEMGDYVYARHAKQANEHVASINPDKPTGGSGMTDERAQEILDGVRKDPRRAVFESVAKKFDAVVEMTRQRLIDAGLETPEKVQMWREMFDSYVALKGTATEGGQRKGGAGIRGPESKRRMGRSSEAFNPFVQVLADGYEKIVRAEANKSYQPLLDLAEAHPDPETWAVFSEDSPEQGKRLKVWYENPETLETSSKPKNGYVRKAEVVKTPDNLKMYGSDYLGVKRNGKQYFIGIRDKSLREALIGMPPGSAEKVIAPIRFATRLYSSLRTTYSPLFWARNLPRDLQTAEAFVAAEKGKGGRIEGAKVNPSGIVRGAIKTMPEVYRHLHGKGESNTEIAKYITEGREDGVKTDWIDAPDAEQLYKQLVKELNPTAAQKTIHALDTPFRFLRSINDVVENATRFSVYIECRKAGVSRAMSAHMAKNATVNFERHGSLGPIANAFYAFANAGVQGSWNSLKMGRTNTGKVVFGGVIGLGALLAQYNHMVSDKDKDGVSEYSKILKADRGSNLIIMDPSGNGYTKIPFMRGLNVLLNAGTALADWMNDEMSPTQSAAFVTGSVLDAMSPIGSDRGKDALGTFGKTITPSIGRDTMDIITNTNFYGAPIYPESGGKAPKPDSSMAQRDTPEPYKKFVKWLNEKSGGNESVPGWLDFHPESLEYAAMALVGGVYREASNFGTLASKGPKATPPNRFPGKNIFRGATSPVFDSQQFKERETKLLQMEKHAKTLKGPERTKAVDWVVLNSVKSTSKQIDALRDRLDKINARVVKTPQQLQAQMTEAAGVEQQIQDAYKKFNKLYNERIGKHE